MPNRNPLLFLQFCYLVAVGKTAGAGWRKFAGWAHTDSAGIGWPADKCDTPTRFPVLDLEPLRRVGMDRTIYEAKENLDRAESKTALAVQGVQIAIDLMEQATHSGQARVAASEYLKAAQTNLREEQKAEKIARINWVQCNAHLDFDLKKIETSLSVLSAPNASDGVADKFRISSTASAKPRLAESALIAWWNNLSFDIQEQGQVALLDLCRVAHPKNSISRERIRNLTTGRKRGPRLIGGKTTA